MHLIHLMIKFIKWPLARPSDGRLHQQNNQAHELRHEKTSTIPQPGNDHANSSWPEKKHLKHLTVREQKQGMLTGTALNQKGHSRAIGEAFFES